ncbi:hypothetical protein [Roseivivax sp. CAU 1753]
MTRQMQTDHHRTRSMPSFGIQATGVAVALVGLFLLSGCLQETEVDAEACERHGGRYETFIGSGESYCNLPTSDAGKVCAISADCETYCQADTLTCMPYKVLASGCHSWIADNGDRVDMCFE